MDLVGMEMFARVVDAGGFSAAARRLGVSKSVVSRRITAIERTIGAQLLNRTTRAVSLTEIGRAFYERCAEMVALAEEAERVAGELQSSPRGTLKVVVPVSFGVLHIAPALRPLLAENPGLRVEMTLTDRPVNLVDEGYDASVVVAQEIHPGLVARRLAPVRRRACASPDYVERAGAPERPRDLLAHDCLAFHESGERKWCFEGPDGSVEIAVHGTILLNNENAIRQAALAGLGVAVLPTYLIGADLRDGRLQMLLPGYPPATSGLFAVYPPNRHLSPKVRAFVDFLVKRYAGRPPWDEAIDGEEDDER